MVHTASGVEDEVDCVHCFHACSGNGRALHGTHFTEVLTDILETMMVTRNDTDDVLQANARGRQKQTLMPHAVSARFNVRARKVVVLMDNGCEFAFPPNLAQGLTEGTNKQLSVIEVSPTGLGLHWPLLDADLYVPSLVQGVFGSKEWMRRIGSLGGASTSESKREAARFNGRLGGRPKAARPQRLAVTR